MIGIKEMEKSQLAVLSQGEVFTVTADEQPARLILVAGKPLREPVVKYGPFVMNTPEEIHQAVADYQAGRL
jgi:redox-sensitive bicupin YhaK (pirin superfamily)